MKQPRGKRVRRRVLLRKEHPVEERLATHAAPKHRHDHHRKEPNTDLGRSELSVGSRHCKVTGRNEAKTSAHRMTLHFTYNGSVATPERREQVRVVAPPNERVRIAALHLREVRTAAEALSVALQEEHTARSVRLRRIEGVQKFTHHARANGVTTLGKLQGDTRNRTVEFEPNFFVRGSHHAAPPRLRILRASSTVATFRPVSRTMRAVISTRSPFERAIVSPSGR